MGKRRKEIAEFEPLSQMLAAYGFVNMAVGRNNMHKHLYQKGDYYIDVSISFHPYDYPFYCRVVLGEGSISWPDCDWNSISLSQLVKAKSAEHYGGKTPYSITSQDDIADVILNVCDDIEQYVQDFLAGDLVLFKTLRAEQNEGSSTYHLLKPRISVNSQIENDTTA